MMDQSPGQEIIDTAQAFNRCGLSVGKSGNLSRRNPQGFLITPSGLPYSEMTPESLVQMDLDGQILGGKLGPSSEWHFHRAIYAERPEINAVVHVHSPYATGIACNRSDIPAFHYMVAIAGGDSIRCAEYATFGTEELSRNALRALADRRACLLANHGQIALGASLSAAFDLAVEVENLARQYWISRLFGEPAILDSGEMSCILEKFKTYGKPRTSGE